MLDIRRSLMIFHLKEGYSQEELQKSYKKLVKKYHPDFNQQNQDWAHQKMTEINLAYELCKQELSSPVKEPPQREPQKKEEQKYPFDFFKRNDNPFQQKNRQKKTPEAEPLSSGFLNQLKYITRAFCRASDRYYEYGLQNRFLRYEGNRKFRYRQCLKELESVIEMLKSLDPYSITPYDKHIKGIYSRFILHYYNYIILDQGDIPRHPSINSHWNSMEDYLNKSLTEYLASHLTEQFKRTNWQVSLAHCVNHMNYLQGKYPRLREEDSFVRIVRLTESYSEIRQEEEKSSLHLFLP